MLTLDDRTFFDQTVTINQTIHEGDLVNVEIPALRNFFVDVPLIKDNFNWKCELIVVVPKPLNEGCVLLKRLKLIDNSRLRCCKNW
jgi:hypothetical protein